MQSYFVSADEGYGQAMAEYEDALEVVADAKAVAFDARERVKDIEAEFVLNGANGHISAGMTEKKREMVVRVQIKDFAPYQQARQALREAERELDRAEARRDTAANRMALYRRRLDAYLAASNQRAAVLQAHQVPTEGRNRR